MSRMLRLTLFKLITIMILSLSSVVSLNIHH